MKRTADDFVQSGDHLPGEFRDLMTIEDVRQIERDIRRASRRARTGGSTTLAERSVPQVGCGHSEAPRLWPWDVRVVELQEAAALVGRDAQEWCPVCRRWIPWTAFLAAEKR